MNSLAQRFHVMRQNAPNSGIPRFRQAVYQFDLMSHLVWRDFSLRYKRSALGVLWSLVSPLAQLLVLAFLFQSVVPLNIEAYPAFVFAALLPWSWFSSSVGSACGLFIVNRDLMRHPNFAPAHLMIVNTLSNLITYLVALPILFVVLTLYGLALTPALLLLPLLLVIQGILTVGLSLIVATLNVFYRDVQHIVMVLLLLLFYLTPVFYRSQSVVEKYHIIYTLNPITVLIQSYRAIFFYGVAPSWVSLLFASVAAIVICAGGYLLYRRQQHNIFDLL
jgi:homopolymeric O-antigen transport system permease protein